MTRRPPYLAAVRPAPDGPSLRAAQERFDAAVSRTQSLLRDRATATALLCALAFGLGLALGGWLL